jgi:uncharacterized membrane protein
MDKRRIEAFSDGVYAIAITLLILEIKIPEVEYEHLSDAILKIMPNLASYIMSFWVIGLYWTFHHMYFDRIKKINGNIILLNFASLLLVSFMPFPTSLMGRYPFTTIPVMIYGACLLTLNMFGFATFYYICQNPDITKEKYNIDFFKSQMPVYAWVNVPYVLALFIALWVPWFSYLIFVFVLLGVSINTLIKMNNISEEDLK